MTSADRSRDLLFGVVALQLSFVTREQFVEIMTLLPHQPEESAASLFCRKGYLDADQERALSALLVVQLARHGGDAARSIAAFESSPTVAQSMSVLREQPAGQTLAQDDVSLPSDGMGAPVGRPDRYDLGAELGRGGVGRVVLAVDRDLMDREVAMKLLLEGGSSRRRKRGGEEKGGRSKERFLEEAHVTAHLQHPNIVAVYELGTSRSGDLYYTMPVVRGRTFKVEIARAHERRANGLMAPEEWAVERMRQLSSFQGVCHAIAYAHSRGVVHRDIKPHNVMLGEFGEAIVLDWGLAKVLERAGRQLHDASTQPTVPGERPTHRSDEELERMLRSLRRRKAYQTLEGSIAGTPAYMAPEQAEGKISEIDERSDIYSLGAMLFEILTGRAPFDGVDAAAVLYRVAKGPSPDPRSVAPDVDDHIAAICLRAMSHEKGDRYPSVLALSRDIALYTEGAKERQRRRDQAARLVAFGQEKAALHASLRTDLAKLHASAAELERQLRGPVPVERKRPLWDLEDRAAVCRREVWIALAEAERCFHKALEWEADNADARRGLSDLYFRQFLEAEVQAQPDDVHYYRQLVESYHDGRYARELAGDGTLRVGTTPAGAHLYLYRYEVRDRRTLPVPWRAEAGADLGVGPGEVATAAGWYLRPSARDGSCALGASPLEAVAVPMGSYLLIARRKGYRDVRCPVKVGRNEDVVLDLHLFREGEVGEGFVHVPAGPFVRGGDSLAQSGLPRDVVHLPDFFIGRFPVTCAEYLEYLDDVGRRDAEEARRRVPRRADGTVLWSDDPAGRFHLPEGPDEQKLLWAPDQPVVYVTWDDANAYAEWRSRRDGRLYRLPFATEWEKAARGVDERIHPWGSHFDATWCNMVESRIPEAGRIGPVGEFPVDESPYGVRDLAGNVFDWCLDLFEEDKVWRTLKGGAFFGGAIWCRSASRAGFVPTERRELAGFRLVSTPAIRQPG